MTGHQHTDEAGGSHWRLTYADFREFPNDGQRRVFSFFDVVLTTPSLPGFALDLKKLFR